jgi:Lrp/AsnC family leucine-responsive transcriptional regulator
MSAPAVRERLLKLEESGVIVGYRVDFDAASLGRPVGAFIRVRPAPGQLPKVAELAEQMREVVECHRVTGEDCFVMNVQFESLEKLDALLDRFLAHGQTTTSIIQSTIVPRRSLPLPDEWT